MKALETCGTELPEIKQTKPGEENTAYLGHFKNPSVIKAGHNTSGKYSAPTLDKVPVGNTPSNRAPFAKKTTAMFPSIGSFQNKSPSQMLGNPPPKKWI